MTSQVAGEGSPRVSLPLTGLYQTHECHASLSHTLQFSQLGQQQFFDQLTIFFFVIPNFIKVCDIFPDEVVSLVDTDKFKAKASSHLLLAGDCVLLLSRIFSFCSLYCQCLLLFITRVCSLRGRFGLVSVFDFP